VLSEQIYPVLGLNGITTSVFVLSSKNLVPLVELALLGKYICMAEGTASLSICLSIL
jgi:hypothetical protein